MSALPSQARCAWLRRRARGPASAVDATWVERWYVYLPLRTRLGASPSTTSSSTGPEPPLLRGLARLGRNFARGDLIVYRFDGEELMYLKKGQRFFKRIVGVAGDRVSIEGRRVLINGADVGIAKQYTLDGHRLEPLEPGVIPPDYYYVQGTTR